jgi:Cu/Ag efflux pump CusA
VGLVAVLAIAFRQVLEIADRSSEAAEADPDAAADEIVVRGVVAARHGIAVSALAITALFLPAVILGDVAGLEVVRPMAAVVIGGALGSLVLNLLIVPAVTLRSGSRREPDIAAGLIEQPAPGLA